MQDEAGFSYEMTAGGEKEREIQYFKNDDHGDHDDQIAESIKNNVLGCALHTPALDGNKLPSSVGSQEPRNHNR